MNLDFGKIKAIPILAVCGKYGIKLRFNGEWGSALCPLPSHKQGDKDKTFQVSVRQNFFKCWSKSCNEKAGCKGGDVISFVALMENCSQFAAAQKLSEMFEIEKAAEPIAQRQNQKQTIKGTDCNSDSPSVEVKSGYLHETGIWLDEILAKVIPDEVVRKTVKKMVMGRIFDSYQNGRRSVLAGG